MKKGGYKILFTYFLRRHVALPLLNEFVDNILRKWKTAKAYSLRNLQDTWKIFRLQWRVREMIGIRSEEI